MSTFTQDLNYGFRLIAKKKIFSAVVIITLAVGIGATSVIYSVVQAVVLRPLPYRNPERLAMLWETHQQRGWKTMTVSYPNFLDWKELNHNFADLGAFINQEVTLMGTQESERVAVTAVTAGTFPLLGVTPTLGRDFTPEEDRPGNNRVAILSYGLWQKQFGADPQVLNKSLMINGVTFNVVGVMPADFQFPPPLQKDDKRMTPAHLWIPLGFDPAKQVRSSHNLFVVGRLKGNTATAGAQRDMDVVAEQLQERFSETNRGYGVNVVPLHQQVIGDIKTGLWVLLGAVGFVLLLACSNVANLLLAQMSSRQKEMAIRVAMGAKRGRIIRQLLTENLLFALAGGLLGLALASWGIDLFIALGNDPRLKGATVDLRVIGFTMLISLASLFVFGLLPSLKLANPDLNHLLKEGGRLSAMGLGRHQLRNLIVVFESALVMLLLIGAGLLIKSFIRLQQTDLGFNPSNAVAMDIHLSPTKYSDPQQQQTFITQTMEQLKNLPGVQRVGAVTGLPLVGDSLLYTFNTPSRPATPDLQQVAEYHMVSPDYFDALQVPIVNGRGFTEADTKEGVGVVLINETMAERYWLNRNPVGDRLALEIPSEVAKYGKLFERQIVGVVGDVTYANPALPPKPEVYIPMFQNTTRSLSMVLRTTGNPDTLIRNLKNTIRNLDSQVPVYNVKTLDQVVANSIAPRKFNTTIFSFFAGVGLLLAAIGIYGVVSYFTSERTHEIGLRMALGADRGNILSLIVKRGMTPVLIGLGIGLAGAIALTRVMASLLFAVESTDALTFLLATAFFIVVALLACYLPASRATRVNPIVALRSE